MSKKDPVLCYIDSTNTWAYFVPNLKDAKGDDWNDTPYEHNSSRPYNEDAVQVAFEFKDWSIETPCSRHTNSPYCVDDINAGKVPWIFHRKQPGLQIWAGTPLSKFKELVKQAGGKVYIED